MRRFTQLFDELDASNRTLDKVDALKRYFREAPPADATWGLWLLVGKRFPALVKSKRLREWAADAAGLPDWLVDECYERVGDLAETVSLLLPLDDAGTDLPLHVMLEEKVRGLGDWDDVVRFQLLREIWKTLNRPQAFVFHKMLTGGLRVGVSRSLVIRALAEMAGVEKQIIAHRLMGNWQPTARFFTDLLAIEEGEADNSRPYPFYLASPLDDPANELPDAPEWLLEWKWDGIRAQLIKRKGELFLWSRGDELVSEQFPEILESAARLPNGTVLDGEILCWSDGRPLGFNALQTRIGRKYVSPKLRRECPAVFMAYDYLEADGEDIRRQPLRERRARLETLCREHGDRAPALRISPLVEATSWSAFGEHRATSRAQGVEGLMIKHRESPYESGRVRGSWWKWKVAPLTADLVMIYAQAGHGRRASQFTDYTLAAWDGDELVPVAKAYTGLTAEEIREVDAWVKSHTLKRHGPVRTVPGELVFEIAFEGIRPSKRHRSGIALRFPRIHRWRRNKPASEADSLATLRALIAAE